MIRRVISAIGEEWSGTSADRQREYDEYRAMKARVLERRWAEFEATFEGRISRRLLGRWYGRWVEDAWAVADFVAAGVGFILLVAVGFAFCIAGMAFAFYLRRWMLGG